MPNAATPDTHSPRRARTEAIAEQLYAAHHPRLLAIARRNSTSIEDAEEALQDAFLLFIDHFDPAEEAPPLAWLTLTLKRRCWALSKERRSRSGDGRRALATLSQAVLESLPDLRRSPDEAAEASETVEQLRRRLTHLKPDQRKALGLFALGYSYREIATTMHWTYTKVDRCIKEGRATLREAAKDEPP